MANEPTPIGRSLSPFVGLLIVAHLADGRLVGEIVGTAGDLAIVEALDESDIQGPGLLLLRLGSVAMPGGSCRMFRTRKELADAASPPGGASSSPPSRRRSQPQLAAIKR